MVKYDRRAVPDPVVPQQRRNYRALWYPGIHSHLFTEFLPYSYHKFPVIQPFANKPNDAIFLCWDSSVVQGAYVMTTQENGTTAIVAAPAPRPWPRPCSSCWWWTQDTVGVAHSSRTKDPESIEIIPLSLQELYNNDITNPLYITYNIRP